MKQFLIILNLVMLISITLVNGQTGECVNCNNAPTSLNSGAFAMRSPKLN